MKYGPERPVKERKVEGMHIGGVLAIHLLIWAFISYPASSFTKVQTQFEP